MNNKSHKMNILINGDTILSFLSRTTCFENCYFTKLIGSTLVIEFKDNPVTFVYDSIGACRFNSIFIIRKFSMVEDASIDTMIRRCVMIVNKTHFHNNIK